MRRVVIAPRSFTLSVTVPTSLNALDRIGRLSFDEAVSLALLENPTVRAKEFERQATAANEITAGLRPTLQVMFLAEQHPAGSAAIPQYTFSVRQPIELGSKRQRRVDGARAATQVTRYELALKDRPCIDFLDAHRTYRETSLEYLRALGSYRAAVYQL